MDVRGLGALQLDALREVANIGAGHAATALSSLTNRRIGVDVPEIRVLRLEDVATLMGDPGELVAAVLMQVVGDVTGRTIQAFSGDSASRLAGILLNRDPVPFPDGFGDLEQSALKEVGNILVGAYLNALSDFLGMMCLMSVPSLALDMAGAVFTSGYLNFGEENDHVFCIDTSFHLNDGGGMLRGHFMLLPDAASLEVILRAMGLS